MKKKIDINQTMCIYPKSLKNFKEFIQLLTFMDVTVSFKYRDSLPKNLKKYMVPYYKKEGTNSWPHPEGI